MTINRQRWPGWPARLVRRARGTDVAPATSGPGTFMCGALTAGLAVMLAGQIPSAGTVAARPERQATAALKGGALATFDVSGERFRVWVTNPKTIGQLQALQAGTSQANIPNGRILPGPGKAAHNRPWRWHLDPQDIQMAEMTTEVCDARPSYVNAHLYEFVHTVKRYCPWSAKLVALKVIPPIAASAPAMPTDLRVVSVTEDGTSTGRTTIALQWSDASTNESGFRIRTTLTRAYEGIESAVQETGANATSAGVEVIAGGINPVAKACFTVSAFNATGESSPSNEVCVTL